MDISRMLPNLASRQLSVTTTWSTTKGGILALINNLLGMLPLEVPHKAIMVTLCRLNTWRKLRVNFLLESLERS